MLSTILASDVAIIAAACELANLPSSASAADVNKVVSKVARRERRSTASQWNPATLALMAAIQGDLEFLRACLDALRGDPHALSRALRGRLEKDYLPSVAGSVTLADSPTGPILAIRPQFTGVASIVGYAVAMLADTQHGAAERIGRCALSDCNRYFFDARTGSGRYRTSFCTKQHNDLAAQRARRARQKEDR